MASQMFRHSSLWINALEFVEMGDSNSENHRIAMEIFSEGKKRLAEASQIKDFLGLGHQVGSNAGGGGDDELEELVLRAPKKRARGHPTTARDKAAYENLSKRTRHCTQCASPDHTRQYCPNREAGTSKQRKPPTCSRCGLSGHNRNSCASQAQQLVVIQ